MAEHVYIMTKPVQQIGDETTPFWNKQHDKQTVVEILAIAAEFGRQVGRQMGFETDLKKVKYQLFDDEYGKRIIIWIYAK